MIIMIVIIKTDQNTEKSPGDCRRLAVTQSPMKNHQIPQGLIIKEQRKTNTNQQQQYQQNKFREKK